MELAQLVRVLAPIHAAAGVQRISGGSETDVYRLEDGRSVLKVKQLAATSREGAQAEIEEMQAAAQSFATYLGVDHSIQTHFVLSEDEFGKFYALGFQSYLADARPLAEVDVLALHPQERTQVEWQLLLLLRQALQCYHATGHMPDLYGTYSRSIVERQRMNSPLMWPKRV